MRIDLDLGARGYPILIEDGLIDRAEEHLGAFARERLVVVSDETVWTAQGARLMAGLGGIEAEPVLVPPGETSKSWAVLEDLLDRLIDLGVARGDAILAFGGGMIGDLAGFAAAILKRGVDVVQVPTSLLAQVDSSVGGKTGIDTRAGKNLVGAFHQPRLVLIDPLALATLDPAEVRAGYAEIVKYALIEDAGFFVWLEANGAAVIAGDAEARRHAIATAVAGKARIVGDDERETGGRRALLNLGHSFGHAIEMASGYSIRHGEAVATGLRLAFDFSVARGLCAAEDAARVHAHLDAVGLEAPPVTTAIVGHMRHDKKASRDGLTLILARGIGQAFVQAGVEPEEVETFLSQLRSGRATLFASRVH